MNFKKVLLFLVSMGTLASAAPDFSMMGFATADGGTTGGKGGAVVTPTSLSDLKQYAENKTTPYIIRITKEFNSGQPVSIDGTGFISGDGNTKTTYASIVRLGSNKTLIGIGSSAFFNRVGIVVQRQSNIIIRNIVFTMKDVPISNNGENKVVGLVNGVATMLSDPDCIGIQADDSGIAEASQSSKHIWIDHCEFYNEDPSVMTNVDRYDGLIDGKNNSTDITVSWCYFHDHHKASLMGHGNSDDYDRRITYSHNYFKNIASRLPLIRFGECHLLNNYMITSENGANARINSDIYVEGNHFEASKKPVFGKVSENGAATFVNNEWVTCSVVPAIVLSQASGAKALNANEEVLPGSFKPSSFYSYSADPVADVASKVSTYSGVGKINTDEYNGTQALITVEEKGIRFFAYVNNRRIFVRALPGTPVCLYNLFGAVVYSGKTAAASSESVLPLLANKGVYMLKIGGSAETLIVQ
jgi:pectate lyase